MSPTSLQSMRYWRWMLRTTLLRFIVLFAPLFLISLSGVSSSHWIHDLEWVAPVGILLYRFYPLWRLGHHYRRILKGRILYGTSRSWTLRYPAALRGSMDVESVQRLVEQTVRELDAVFARDGRPARGYFSAPALPNDAITVFIYPSPEAVEQAFGRNVAGVALPHNNCIVIPFTGLPLLQEVLRHELAHLYITRAWARATPPLLSEGLPVWLQQSVLGVKIDRIAAHWIEQGKGDLRPLLKKKSFKIRAQGFQSYALAGSFTGFLLRRFGRDVYLSFYESMYNGWHFDRKFTEHFGLTLESAENEWQREALEAKRAAAMSDTPTSYPVAC
jgi:hypothetical protein